MSARAAVLCGVALLAGCATAAPGFQESVRAAPDALRCAHITLVQRDFETGGALDASPDAVVAELRRPGGPTQAVREVLTADRVASPDGERLVVRVRAFEYLPAMDSSPLRRQTVTEVEPSSGTIAAARAVLTACGTPAGSATAP